jgi:hypothetical protein
MMAAMLPPLEDFDAYREAWWAHERDVDARMRAGVGPDGEALRYRYIGPPHVFTPARWLLRSWLGAIEARAQARAAAWLAPKTPPKTRREFEHEAMLRDLATAGTPKVA